MSQQKLFLICDSVGDVEMKMFNVTETTSKTGLGDRVKFVGPMTEVERLNKNNRLYRDGIMRPEFNRCATLASNGRLLGEADHPPDSIVHVRDVSHRFMRMWWDTDRKNVGWCECVTSRTPNGIIVRNLMEDGIPLGISTRGVGSGSVDRDGHLIIAEGFRLITGDIVCDPSYQEAWMSMKESVMDDVKTGRKRFYIPEGTIKNDPLPVVSTKIEEATAEDLGGQIPKAGQVAKLGLNEVMMIVANAAAKAIKS